MRKIYGYGLALLLVLALVGLSAAQTGIVQGLVTNSTGAPVDSAYVMLKKCGGCGGHGQGQSGRYTTYTGTDGTYLFPTVVPGFYRAGSMKAGVGKDMDTLTVVAGNTYTVNFVLMPGGCGGGMVDSCGHGGGGGGMGQCNPDSCTMGPCNPDSCTHGGCGECGGQGGESFVDSCGHGGGGGGMGQCNPDSCTMGPCNPDSCTHGGCGGCGGGGFSLVDSCGHGGGGGGMGGCNPDSCTMGPCNPDSCTHGGCGEDAAQPKISKAYPNPFNPSTSISFDLPQSAQVNLSVWNLNGQRVALLTNSQMEAGVHRMTWNAENLASGIYLVRLEAANTVSIKRVVFTK